MQPHERLRRERLVDRAPVNVRFRRRLPHEEAVLRRAAGVDTGADRDGAGLGHDAFAAVQLHIAVILL